MMKAIENRYVQAAQCLAAGDRVQLHRITDSCDALLQTLDAIRQDPYHNPEHKEYRQKRATGWEPADFAEIRTCKEVLQGYLQLMQGGV